MFRQIRKYKATATVEYMILIVLILGAFFIFRDYIIKGISGRWKSAGDTFAFGRRYSPGVTDVCAYDYTYHNMWYNYACFEERCDCFTLQRTKATCQDCIGVTCAAIGLCDQ